jgi:hypothetical protein
MQHANERTVKPHSELNQFIDKAKGFRRIVRINAKISDAIEQDDMHAATGDACPLKLCREHGPPLLRWHIEKPICTHIIRQSGHASPINGTTNEAPRITGALLSVEQHHRPPMMRFSSEA